MDLENNIKTSNFMPSHFAKFPHSAKKHTVDLDDDTTLPLVDKKQTTSVVVVTNINSKCLCLTPDYQLFIAVKVKTTTTPWATPAPPRPTGPP